MTRIQSPFFQTISIILFLISCIEVRASQRSCNDAARGSTFSQQIETLAEADVMGIKKGELELARSVEDFLEAASPGYLSSLALAFRLPFVDNRGPTVKPLTSITHEDRVKRLYIALVYLSHKDFEQVAPHFLDSRLVDFLIGALSSVPLSTFERSPGFKVSEVRGAVRHLLEVRGDELPSVERLLTVSPMHRFSLPRVAPLEWRLPPSGNYLWTAEEIKRAARKIGNQPPSLRLNFTADWLTKTTGMQIADDSLRRLQTEHMIATEDADLSEILLFRQRLSLPTSYLPPEAFGFAIEMSFAKMNTIYRSNDMVGFIRKALSKHLDRVMEDLTDPSSPRPVRPAVQSEPEPAFEIPPEWRYVPYQEIPRLRSDGATPESAELFFSELQSFADLQPATDYSVVWRDIPRVGQQKKTVRFTARAVRDLAKLGDFGTVSLEKWIEALGAGPARLQGQRGWKLLGDSPIREFPDVTVEIKLLASTIRLYGRQLPSGVVEFVAAFDGH